MQKTKRIPSQPRFDFVVHRAYSLLAEIGFSEFPVSPWDIIKEYSDNILCFSWSELHDAHPDTDPLHLAKLQADGKVIRIEDTNQYMIVYDDVGVANNGIPPTEEHIRWTIMHELGHIFLLHLIDFDETRLDTGRLSDDQYGVLEKEAHFFAAEMYIPTALFKYLSTVTVEDLMVLCDISRPAAIKRHRALYTNNYHPNTVLDNRILRNFHNFLFEGRYAESQFKVIVKRWGRSNYKSLINISRKCPSCHAFTSDDNARYCTYCGFDFEEHNRNRSYYERLEEVQQLAESSSTFERVLPVNRDGKITVCPVCMNQDISPTDDFCTVCGQPLTNYCTAEHKPVDASFRCCPDCGEPATFERPYSVTRKRLSGIKAFVIENEDPLLFEYEHWQFIQLRVGSVHPKLRSLLFFTEAYLDDDDNLFIYTDDPHAKDFIEQRVETIRDIIKDNDSLAVKNMEVKKAYDL